MLREVRSSFLRPRLLALQYTTASNVVTVNEGVGSATITSAATGSGVSTWKSAFARRPIVVANADGGNVAAGGFVNGTANTFPTATGHTMVTVNSSATADDGTCHALVLGYGMKDQVRYSRRSNVVRGELDQTKIIACRVDTSGSGSVTINARNVSISTRTGTGDVTLSLRSAFAHTGFTAVGTAVKTTGQIVQTQVTNSSTVRIRVFTNGGTTPADGVVNLLLVGDGQGPAERTPPTPAMNDQRMPVLFGYSVIYASGVPSYDFNSGDATLADTATGRTTFTYLQPYLREPIVVAMPVSNTGVQCCTIYSSSTSAIQIGQFSSANALADCTDTSGFQLIGVGWDDSSEY